MYDFYLGTSEEIAQDEERYLIAVKRMMPRWINSLADSEFLALAEILDDQGKRAVSEGRRFVAVETGCGASTLAMAFYAMKYDGIALSWDPNFAKGSAVRQVCVETMGAHFAKPIDSHWRLVAFVSTSPHLGLPILGEIADGVDVSFHDSEHTWQTLGQEIEAVSEHLVQGAIVCMDDANARWEHTNVGYINTFRRKLGLADISPIEANVGEPFYERTERLLRDRFDVVERLDSRYKHEFKNDPYFAYYSAELDIRTELGTERADDLEHRFDSWRLSGRRKG